MPEQSNSTPLDLTRYTEGMRRELYDRVVQHLWTPDHADDYTPEFSPDAAQLAVYFLAGRWFLTYIDLDEPADAPPDRRIVVSRVLAAPDRRFGIQLSEV